ncbi:MAG: hypothetical protein H7Z12_13735 [Rhodospirillaceae bacterium]|nr:hypothetical protein [Rhodospirillales bacterium]
MAKGSKGGKPPSSGGKKRNTPSGLAALAELLTVVVSKGGLYLLIGYGIYTAGEIIKELAGKETHADIVIGWMLSGSGKSAGAFGVLALITSSWAVLERRFRRRKTETLTRRLRELEHRLDPDRSSSGLAETGETHPDDL